MDTNGPKVDNGPVGSKGPLIDNGPKINNRARNSGIEQENRSGNLDFSELCKTTFRYVQISHHLENWQNVPASIGKNIGSLISNIKPPMPSNELADKLTAIGLDFGNKIAETVKSHMQTVKVNVESGLLGLDNEDVDRAHTIVKKQLDYKLGRKMTGKNQEQWLTEAKGLVNVEKSTNDVSRIAENNQLNKTTTTTSATTTTGNISQTRAVT